MKKKFPWIISKKSTFMKCLIKLKCTQKSSFTLISLLTQVIKLKNKNIFIKYDLMTLNS